MLAAEARHAEGSPNPLQPAKTAPPRKLADLDVAWLFVGIGAFLRIYQYAWNRSLFIDEAALGLNLRTHGFTELLGRLDYAQFAPLGFLYLQKVLRELFGESEYVLRTPALVAGLASLVLFVVLARRVLPPMAVWLAVALFAMSRYLVFWSSDAKPYAFDVLATIVIVLLTLEWMDRPTRRASLRLGIAGAVAPFFSLASVLLLAGIACVVLARGWREKREHAVTAILPWLAGAPAVIHSFLGLTFADRAYFRADWREGFLPLPLADGAWQAYWVQLTRTLRDPLGFEVAAAVYFALGGLVAGALWLASKRPRIAALFAAPVLVAWAASMAGVYPIGQRWPFYGRVLLFLAPLLILAIAASLAWLRRPALAVVCGALLLGLEALPAIVGTPFTRAEVRRALEYVERGARREDVVYLHYAMALPFAYYRPGIAGRTVQGACAQEDRERYIIELERLRGNRRVWVVLGYDPLNEHALFLEYMRRNAVPLDSASFRYAEARLYDMSGTARGDPDRALVHPPYGPHPGTACMGVFTAGTQS